MLVGMLVYGCWMRSRDLGVGVSVSVSAEVARWTRLESLAAGGLLACSSFVGKDRTSASVLMPNSCDCDFSSSICILAILSVNLMLLN
jgi:hypothetical protein